MRCLLGSPVSFDINVTEFSKPDQSKATTDVREKAMLIQHVPLAHQYKAAQDLAQTLDNPLLPELCNLINKGKDKGIPIFDLKV
jgi:hypothetical protein